MIIGMQDSSDGQARMVFFHQVGPMKKFEAIRKRYKSRIESRVLLRSDRRSVIEVMVGEVSARFVDNIQSEGLRIDIPLKINYNAISSSSNPS